MKELKTTPLAAKTVAELTALLSGATILDFGAVTGKSAFAIEVEGRDEQRYVLVFAPHLTVEVQDLNLSTASFQTVELHLREE